MSGLPSLTHAASVDCLLYLINRGLLSGLKVWSASGTTSLRVLRKRRLAERRTQSIGAEGFSYDTFLGVPRLTTSPVAPDDSTGRRAAAYWRGSNCAGKRSRSRRCPSSCLSQRGHRP